MSAVPVFLSVRSTVTVSPGSIAPVAGEQLSAVSAEPSVTIAGTGVMHRLTTVVLPLVMTTPVVEPGPKFGAAAVTENVPGGSWDENDPPAPLVP